MRSLIEQDKPSKNSVKRLLLLALGLVIITIFMWNNYGFYQTPLAKILQVKERFDETKFGVDGSEEDYFLQEITAVGLNGKEKGEKITLTHLRSQSGVFDNNLQKGDDIFISFDEEKNQWTLEGIKRDHFLMLGLAVFIFMVALVGRHRGILSLLSVVVNILIFIWVIYSYLQGINILGPTILAVIFFSIFSILFYCGFKKMSFVAIIATLCGLAVSAVIMVIVIIWSNYDGVWVESLDFLIIETDYRSVFFAGLLVGGLGGIMDIAITITSSLFELKNNNVEVTSKELMVSGRNIGKDIMGTMVNVMFFTFLAGSSPIILLAAKNGIGIGDYLTNFATLEIVRFLAGSIGLVVTIPISLVIVIFILQRRKRV